MRRLLILVVGVALTAVRASAQTPTPTLDSFERGIAADPENLKLAAEYRQLAISTAKFDRSIAFLEKLADRKGSGPNIKISLALAYVDKVPPSSDWSRLFLGRDAKDVLTKAIAQRPTALAYYIRGLIHLYYNNLIFKRIPQGLDDLRKALSLATDDTPPALMARIYVSLGDGQWRLDQKDKAREAWRTGARLFPSYRPLEVRLLTDEGQVEAVVSGALYAGIRVDTSLRDIAP